MIAEHPLVNKMIRAAKLDVHLYEEVERDTRANGQALAAVVIASVAGGIGAGLGGLLTEGGAWFLWGLVIGLVTGLIGWLIWSGITYWLGTTIFRAPTTSATYGELLRTIGFSNSPRVLSVFSFIPFFGGLVLLVVSVWALIAGVIAVRQALDFSTARAIGTVIVGWLVYVLIAFPMLLLVT